MGMSHNSSDVTGNPDPRNFTIEKFLIEVGPFVAIMVHYPECSNFSGRKILVFRGVSREQLIEAKVLDPHFSETGLSPIARFVPTEKGIGDTVCFCHVMYDYS